MVRNFHTTVFPKETRPIHFACMSIMLQVSCLQYIWRFEVFIYANMCVPFTSWAIKTMLDLSADNSSAHVIIFYCLLALFTYTIKTDPFDKWDPRRHMNNSGPEPLQEFTLWPHVCFVWADQLLLEPTLIAKSEQDLCPAAEVIIRTGCLEMKLCQGHEIKKRKLL